MRVGVCVHYTSDWLNLANITIPVLEQYCKKRRYKLYVEEVMAYRQYDGVKKLMQAKYILENNEVVMVMDADTMVTNFTIKVQDFVNDEYDLFITKDFNGINAGVFIIRNSKWGVDLLDYLLSSIGGKIHCEQDALNKYIKENGMDKICIVEHPAFNSLMYENYPEIGIQKHEDGEWKKGDFLLHLPAIPNKKRIEIFNKIKEEIVYE